MGIRQSESLQAFIDSEQRRTLGAISEAVSHPAATLLQSYVEEGIPANIGPLWSRAALGEKIRNGPHASACALDMVSFIQERLQRRVQGGFSILLSAEENVRVLRENLNLSCIASVPQDQRRPRKFLNLSAQHDKETPSVNNTTDRNIDLDSMRCWRSFPRIL